jgi:hypothetical protein
MDPVAARKKHIRWSIAQNPTVIVIKRTEKVRSGGGFVEWVSTIGPLMVRVFMQGGPAGQQDVSSVAGKKETDTVYGLLADHTADLKAGPAVTDKFEAPGLGTFLVRAVYPQVVDGVVVGYQADLERVS